VKIAALLKFSALDYPGKLSAVVFCQGCPLRCRYCHNKDFLDADLPGQISFEELKTFLDTRKDKLEAVVFSGGEPLLQDDLYEAIMTVKNMGFLIGLHTAGSYPERLTAVLELVDWVGFDIKTSFLRYRDVTQIENSGHLAQISLVKLLISGVNYELRTTYDPRYIPAEFLTEIAKTLRTVGATKWIIQECILRDGSEKNSLPLPEAEALSAASKYIDIEVRREW
jgi:pyruvate formate lyase activating enzyme